MSGVDVLAVMRWQHHIIKNLNEASDGVDHALDLEDAALAVEAVAELIEASEAFYEAQTNMDNREYMGVNAEPYYKLQERLHDARRDFESALSRVRGAE